MGCCTRQVYVATFVCVNRPNIPVFLNDISCIYRVPALSSPHTQVLCTALLTAALSLLHSSGLRPQASRAPPATPPTAARSSHPPCAPVPGAVQRQFLGLFRVCQVTAPRALLPLPGGCRQTGGPAAQWDCPALQDQGTCSRRWTRLQRGRWSHAGAAAAEVGPRVVAGLQVLGDAAVNQGSAHQAQAFLYRQSAAAQG